MRRSIVKYPGENHPDVIHTKAVALLSHPPLSHGAFYLKHLPSLSARIAPENVQDWKGFLNDPKCFSALCK